MHLNEYDALPKDGTLPPIYGSPKNGPALYLCIGSKPRLANLRLTPANAIMTSLIISDLGARPDGGHMSTDRFV
jgi:hypothetical protein